MGREVKPDRHRFGLSREAADLLRDGSGQWERVELADGPAAQKMVPGVRGRRSPVEDLVDEPIVDERDPNTLELL